MHLTDTTKRHLMPPSWIAAALGISTQALGKRLKEWELDPVEKHGRYRFYDFRKVLQFRLAQVELPTRSHQEESLALLAAKRKLAELDLAEREGRLANLDQVRAVWAELVAAARSRFLALPHRAGLLVGLTEKEAFVVLKELVWDALDQLSRDGGTTAGGDGAEAREDRGAVSAPEANGGD